MHLDCFMKDVSILIENQHISMSLKFAMGQSNTITVNKYVSTSLKTDYKHLFHISNVSGTRMTLF